MLSRMISDTWQLSDSDSDDKPIFIDRSGDIFAYVLEYLRYGSVVLPMSIPTEMFTRDLDYYLLEYDVSTITDGEERIRERFVTLKKKNDKLNEELKQQKIKYEDQVAQDDALINRLSKLIEIQQQRMSMLTQRMRQRIGEQQVDQHPYYSNL